MKKCPHCQSEVKVVGSTSNKFYCVFCDMNVILEKTATFYSFRGAVDHVDAAKGTKELKTYHTFDLLLLLKFCRQERRTTYQLMQTIGKVKVESKEFAEGYKEAFSQYDYWTKKTRISESLVKERIGTIPKAVTGELLETFYVLHQDSSVLKKYA